MKTRELLKLQGEEMANAIKSMKVKECEKHARKYSKVLGIEFDKAVMCTVYAALKSEEDAHVSKRVHTNIWELAKNESNCTEPEAEILSVLMLMYIYKKTNGFEILETLMSAVAQKA